MLDVNFEFVKGILFVRLKGKINNYSIISIEKNLNEIILKGNLKYVVFNISNCDIEERVDIFDNCNKLIKNNGGEMFICGLKNKLSTVVNKKFNEKNNIKNEISALRMINIC